jgi:hypothetical protein
MTRSVDQTNHLTQDNGDAPGSEQSIEWTLVETPDDGNFDKYSYGTNQEWRQPNTPPRRASDPANRGNHIGAEHEELAMRQIDNAEHAEDDRQAE